MAAADAEWGERFRRGGCNLGLRERSAENSGEREVEKRFQQRKIGECSEVGEPVSMPPFQAFKESRR